MIFSLPSYRRLSEADLERLRKTDDQKPSTRIAGALLNILLLAGLWGVPLYARWIVLPETDQPVAPRKSLIGNWKAPASHFAISFTRDGQFVLSWKETVIETARYGFIWEGDNTVELSDFREQPGERAILENRKCLFRVSVAQDVLSITEALNDDWNRHDRERNWEIHGERLSLPGDSFERVKLQVHSSSAALPRRRRPPFPACPCQRRRKEKDRAKWKYRPPF